MVESASKQFGVEPDLIWTVIRAENSGSPKGAANLKDASTAAISPKNARGVMQVTPIALQEVKNMGLIPSTVTHEGMSPQDQINVGTAYLKRLHDYSDKKEELLAMYNAGPSARFRMDRLPAETRGYLEKANMPSTYEAGRTSESTTVKQGGGGTGTFGQGMLTSADLIQTLQGIATNQNAAIDVASATARAASENAQKLGAQSIEQQREAVGQAAVVAGQKTAIDFAQNNVMNKLQKSFGLDPDDANNEVAQSLAAAESARQARVGARAEYDEVASRDLLTNPIGYLIGQLQMPALAAKNNALADAEDLALQNIDTRTRQLTAQKSVITANTADMIREQQLGQAQVESKIANAKLTAEEAKNSAAAATNAMQMASIENVKGDNLRSTYSTIATLEDRDESRELRKTQKEDMMKAKREKEAEDARMNARLATVSAGLGMVEPMTLSRLKGLTKKDQQEAWTYAALNGQFGADLESSLSMYLGQGNKNGIELSGDASVYSTALKLRNAARSHDAESSRILAASNQGKAAKPEDVVSKSYEVYRNTIVSDMNSVSSPTDLSSSKLDSTFSPYKAQYLSFNRAITENPRLDSLKNNKVKLMIDDLVKSGAVKGDNLRSEQEQQVLTGMAELVKTRQLDSKVAAAHIAAYYSGAAAFNQVLNKADLFGLPKQDAYMFTLEGTFTDNNRKKLNLMNPADVENTLIWRAKQQEVNRYAPIGIYN